MKKFISRLIIFSVIITFITLTVNFAYMTLYKKVDLQETNKFENIPDNLDICNFGSSHGLHAFNYEDITNEGYSCFNFALGSQYPSYDYRVMQQYENHIGEGTIVFIPISYFSLFGKGEEYDNDFASKNKRYYTILSPKLIKDYDAKTNIYVNYLPALSINTSDLKRLLVELTDNADSMSTALDIDVQEYAKDAYNRHVVKEKLDNSGKRIVNQQEVDAIYSMISFCKERGAIPILVTTPFLSEYTDEIKNNSPDFYNDFYFILNEIIEDNGVKYYDYALDERFCHHYDLFYDVDHLNEVGARQFTNILMDEVEESADIHIDN